VLGTIVALIPARRRRVLDADLAVPRDETEAEPLAEVPT
jgi:hypothetical protein